MACDVTLTGITLSCTDIYSGGLKSLVIFNKSDLTDVVPDLAAGTYVAATDQSASGVVIDFNTKDGFSNFSDVATRNIDGSGNVVPTISIELPRMDTSKRAALNAMAVGGAELVAFVETAAGTQHMVGYDFGLIVSSVDGQSGANRSDKNRFQLTLTGDENVLAYQPAAGTDWTNTHG